MTESDEIIGSYPHAQFVVRRDNRVIITYGKGIWNQGMNEKFTGAIKKLVASFDGNPWGLLCCLNDWQLSTHDSVPVIQMFGGWALSNNLRQSALIYQENCLKKYQLQQMVPSDSSDYKTRYFAKEVEAFEWFKDCGFPVRDARCKVA
ncbi:hypothetical protein CA267_003495 [Alteromonas pelagimontana]|uniref:STAS/SEC14 domain-containing protein n=1 Tax=Alteromonas pelagimontana TaxID=1858656 RepID=A0A6M4M9T1_9ALTE|nr:hypothetical protein [Alteromonas pelagimontana]QJR79913.1 hypothetical protein CA267_003495 [Alteromonas pelagimontana]